MIRIFASFLPAVCLLVAGCGGDEVPRLIADLASDEVDVRRAAAQALGTFESEDERIAPALQRAAQDADEQVRRLACNALGEIGAGKGELTTALDDSQIPVRLAAAFALLKIEPGNQAACTVLTMMMKRGDGGVIVAVADMGPAAKWAVPTLVELLRDRRPGIRRLAAEGLGKVSAESPDVRNALQKAAGDSDDRVREAASAALDQLGGK